MLLLLLWNGLDGSGALWQRSQLHLGAQSSGPFLLNEREAQSKSPGQSSVRVFWLFCNFHMSHLISVNGR